MLSRRAFLLLLLALLSLDFGVSEYRMRHETPPGWKTVRWQAGFGSWCCGGYGVAYDIAIPKGYEFSQKCGKAWVTDDDAMLDDFLIEFSFFGTSRSQFDEMDYENYLKTGAVRSAQSFGRRATDIETGAATPYDAGALRFYRSVISLRGEVPPSVSTVLARGFRLKGDSMSIIGELNTPQVDDINDKIIRSMRLVHGFGLFDALAGSVPFLNGC